MSVWELCKKGVPLDKLRVEVAEYQAEQRLTEQQAKDTLSLIETLRAQTHETDLHAAAVSADAASNCEVAALSDAALRELLKERERHMQTPPEGATLPRGHITDQWRVYQYITSSLSGGGKPLRVIVQASAGTGKSFLLSTVFFWCLVHKKYVSAFAPTGIAAANIGINGTAVAATTYHHLFGLNGEPDSKIEDKASDPYVQKLA